MTGWLTRTVAPAEAGPFARHQQATKTTVFDLAVSAANPRRDAAGFRSEAVAAGVRSAPALKR